MAVGTSFRSRRIKEDLFPVNRFEEFVTAGASDVAMLAFQRESRSLVVIERGRFPLRRVMTIAALRYFVREEFGELPAVHVLVAFLALFRRFLEIDIDQLGLQVRRLMAVDARDRAMRALQRERRRAVVEPIQFLPRLGGVASFAPHRLAIFADLLHAFAELALVYVFVATRAGEVVEMIRNL